MKGYRLKSANGERYMDEVQKKPYPSFQESHPGESYGGTLSSPRMGELIYDNTYTVPPTKEAHPSSGIQGFYGVECVGGC